MTNYALQALSTTPLPNILNKLCNTAINFSGNTIYTIIKKYAM